MCSVYKKTVFPLILILTFVLSGCPHVYYDLPEEVRRLGVQVGNYPEWVMESSIGEVITEWSDWQSSAGLLREYLPEDYNKQDYNGSFRLVTGGQYMGIEFDDGSAGFVLYIWIDEISKKTGEVFISLPQPDPSVFIIEGKAQYNVHTPAIGLATLTMTFQETTPLYSKYQYVLIINGQTIVDTEVKAYKESAYTENSIPVWLPNLFIASEAGLSNPFDHIAYQFAEAQNHEGVCFSKGFKCFNVRFQELKHRIDRAMMYRNGLREISVDNQHKKVVYAVSGGAPADPIRFVELYRNTDETVIFNWLDEDGDTIKTEITWVPYFLR